jgi:hypothetical protein
MSPFYPYPPFPHLNATQPCTNFPHPSHTHALLAVSSVSPELINVQNSAGTSLSAAGVIGIIAAVVFVFGGLAWFAWHALSLLPRRKKAILKERKKHKRAVQEHTDRAVSGVGHGGCGHGHSGIY